MLSVLAVTVAATDRTLLTVAERREAAGVSDGSQDTKLAALDLRNSAAIMTECVCDASGVSPTTPCTGCPRWNGKEPVNPILNMIDQVTPRKCKKFSCGNNAYMGGDLCYDCVPF